MKHLLLSVCLFPTSLVLADGCTTHAGPLEPVFLEQIRVEGFWKQQFKLQTTKWLPHCVEQMEKGGAGQELLNLVATARVLRGEAPGWKYTGLPWSDAYVYNTVEAICMALAVSPEGDAELGAAQAQLRSKLEEWIPVILGAQDTNGYIHSFHVLNGRPRYTQVGDHEFYVQGYFLEMGVAHFRMTGGKDRRLYDAAVRCADHLSETFGPAPKRTWRNGHPGLEYALCRLGQLVNETHGPGKGDKYIALARHFLDHQHEGPGGTEYNQSEQPAVRMTEARGHAVRATYFYTAMTEMVLHYGDEAYHGAVDRIWASAIHKKGYLTGGVGASHRGEAFAADYELPNNGYCESCAGCGMSFWADRMHRWHGDAHYRDVQERLLYNNVLGSVELSGTNFFYQNPLESRRVRDAWHACPCCVGNIPRTLFGIKDSMYSLDRTGRELYVNHFVDSEATLSKVADAPLRIRQKTEYPWDGRVTLLLQPANPAEFTLKIRVPDRTESDLYTVKPDTAGTVRVRVNGRTETVQRVHGYLELPRTWKAGDRVQIDLPLPIQRVYCDEKVSANRGHVALQRGPIVYNFEEVDHAAPVKSLVLSPDEKLKEKRSKELSGVVVIRGDEIKAVPNYSRLNRGGASRVWLPEASPDKSGK